MKSLSFRIPDDLAERVAEHSRPWRTRSESDVYRRVIDEWVRSQEHPGIRFVQGPAGRRAALVGAADVWEVVETLRAFEFDHDRFIEAYPWFTEDLIEVATRYYGSFPEEIDALIEDNDRIAEELERELDLVVRERRSAGPSVDEDPFDA